MYKINNKLALMIAASFTLGTTANAVEIFQDSNSIVFDSLSGSKQVLKILSPEGEVESFDVKGDSFTLTADKLGLKQFQNGAYKFEITPYATPNIISNDVRELKDNNVTNDYINTFKAKGEAESGVFTIQESQMVQPMNEDMNKDIQHLDDVIITFSLCVGNDCVNGENFGFDTLRLKENNLRIHFDDTSNSASFPSNDWRIVANDTGNGGANYLAFEDSTAGRVPFKVEAGAPANTLLVDADGDVGIKTANPVVDLHIVEGNTPTLRLEQDGSDGFTPQTYDVAANESNFFIRDVTNGSRLFFRAQPGAPENSIYIKNDGSLGLGTSTPDDKLDLETSGPALRFTNTGSGGGIWKMFVKDDSSRLNFTDDATLARVPIKFSNNASHNLLKVGAPASNEVQINGKLTVNGDITATGSITPDFVFKSDYKLKSIEDHAKFMWENSHLPNVEKARVNSEGKGQFSLNERSQQLLEELEIAHIYIDQLNSSVKQLNQRIEKLEKN